MTTVAVIGCTHAGTFATTSILAEHPDWTVHVFERNGTPVSYTHLTLPTTERV